MAFIHTGVEQYKMYLAKKNLLHHRMAYLSDEALKADLLESHLLWDGVQVKETPETLRRFEFQQNRKFAEFVKEFRKTRENTQGSKVWEYMNWLHFHLIWCLQTADEAGCKQIWEDGFFVIKKYTDKPQSVLLELKHRNVFGTVMHKIFSEGESKRNVIQAKILFDKLVKHEHKNTLKEWMEWTEETYQNVVRVEHIKLTDLYGHFYNLVLLDAIKSNDNLALQLILILRYNMLDTYFMQWLIHATDIHVNCMVLLHTENPHMLHISANVLRAAEVVASRYERNSEAHKKFHRQEILYMIGYIKLSFVHHLIAVINTSHNNPFLEADPREVTFDELIVHVEKRHTQIIQKDEPNKKPTEAKEITEIFKQALQAMKKAKKLMVTDVLVVAATENKLHSIKALYPFLQDFTV